MASGWTYGILGIGIGAVGVIAYNELVVKKKPVPIYLHLEKDEDRVSTTSASISIKDDNGENIIEETPMQKQGDNWYASLKIRELKGNYMAVITLKKGEEEVKKEFSIVLPNYIGMTIPYGEIYENKDGIEIRWI